MKGYTFRRQFQRPPDRLATGPGKGGGTATMVRDHAGKRIDRGSWERDNDSKARQPEKIAIRNVIIRGLSLREEGWVRRKMRIEENSEITFE